MIMLCILVTASPALAWDGFDYNSGGYVEIEKGNLVRPGMDIEIYDYNTGNYHDVTVDSIQGSGAGVEVNVYDNTLGDYRTLDMDNN